MGQPLRLLDVHHCIVNKPRSYISIIFFSVSMPCLRSSKTVNKAAKSDGIPKDRGWAWVIVAG